MYHTIFLTKDYKVMACGSNMQAQLGLGEETKITWEPQYVTKLGTDKIISVCTGIAHTLALSIDNKVYGWGSNDKHQLGFPEKSLKCWYPTEFKGSQFAFI